ncbi:sensor histidine kinase [Robertkochia marina]|nr:sensor histidine kinase [Robertkochia marina]
MAPKKDTMLHSAKLRPYLNISMILGVAALIMGPFSYYYLQTSWYISIFTALLGMALLFNAAIYIRLKKSQQLLIETNRNLRKQNTQDEILLKEIHHRVKNNLQTVSSLLSLQSRNTTDDRTKELLVSSQYRVISMALIHEMLYAYDDISRIQYQEYVEQLASHLIRSIKGVNNNITLKVSMPDIKLGIDTAVPLGLLINEFITNTLKHGILGDKKGLITITLHKDHRENYLLQLKDNGIGFNDTTLAKKPNSLGLRLINNLVRQLRGSLTRETSHGGVHFTVNFREPQRRINNQPED